MNNSSKQILSMSIFKIFKIESVSDLPTTRGKYYVYKDGEFHGEFYYFNAQYRKDQMMKFSHWCEMHKPQQNLNNQKSLFKKLKNKIFHDRYENNYKHIVLMNEKTQS